MTANTPQPSRRDLLKWFAGIPFLPLGDEHSKAAHQAVTAVMTAQW